MMPRRQPRVYEWFFRHVLQRIPSEFAHKTALGMLRVWGRVPGALALTNRLLGPPETLSVKALGLHFRSPLGVGAGVDKNATAFDPLMALGFGSVEVGTATNLPQPGRPGRRVWRLPDDRALLNAMGFPNRGAEAQARRLAHRRIAGVVGANIGKSKVVPAENAIADYRASTRRLAPHADYLAINVSSPNTPGLRDMQTVEQLAGLVDGVRKELSALSRALPVLVKLGPDLANEDIQAIAAASSRIGVDGIIAVNTTTDYDNVPACRATIRKHGDIGGVSGRPLKARALEVLALLRQSADDVPLISVGGVESAEDVWDRILGGATLVQAHTGFVYGGPLWPHRVSRELGRILKESDYATIADAVGKGLDASPGRGCNSSMSGGRVESHTTSIA